MTRRTAWKVAAVALFGLAGAAAVSARAPVDRALPTFVKSGASGTLNVATSGAGRECAAALSDALGRAESGVRASSSSGVAGFTGGTSEVAIVSGTLSGSDIGAFRQKFGYEPTAITLAAEAAAVYVHKDNPLRGLTFQQLDAVFSASRKRGGAAVSTWGDLGGTGAWSSRPVKAFGVGPAAASHVMLRDVVLQGGAMRSDLDDEPGGSGVANAVGVDPAAIGFASAGFETRRARALPVSESGGAFVAPTPEACLNGSYPLSRVVTMYVNKKPGGALSAPAAEFVNLALSREGQEALDGEGLVTLTAGVAGRGRDAIR